MAEHLLTNMNDQAPNPDIYDDRIFEYKFNNKQRKQFQHEIKIHLEKYLKNLLGKGNDSTKVLLWHDLLIIRGERFLTEPEKFIAQSLKGANFIRSARSQITKNLVDDNIPYFEEKLGAKCIYQTCSIEPDRDFWFHTFVFDQVLIEI